ncbi:MAG: galactokinase, partial [Clostridia bacterium]|nr:galactokinase [Clostridia bacterium]
AVLQKEALERGDVKEFLRLVRESGHSSYEYLQNIYVPTNPTVQPIALALNIAQDIIGDEGAYRIHGGGFAGTILVISPWHLTEKFIKESEKVFGKNCVMQIKLK